MKVKIIIGLLQLIFLVGFFTSSDLKANEETSTLLVTGQGEVKAEPDVGSFSVSVITGGTTANEASRSNAEATQKLIDVLLMAGIAQKDIETSNLSINPIYDTTNNTSGIDKVVGYEATNSLRVTVRKINDLGQIIDTVVFAGDYTVNGIGFNVEKTEDLQAEALRKAVGDARRKAEVVAQAANKNISGIKNISIGGSIQFGLKSFGAVSAEASTPILPGDISVIESVSIKYLLD